MAGITRRTFLGAAAAATGLSVFSACDNREVMVRNKPNILFFFPDQWRWDWMSYNKDLPLRTPNIDKLMQAGVTFNRCYSSSPLCAPARACLASGHSFDKCPAPSNRDDYDLSVPTYYQRLRDAGYRVAGVGKFDLHKGLAKPLDWHLDGSRLLDEWGFTDGIDNEGKLDGSGSYRRQGGPKGPYMKFLQDEGVADQYVAEHADAGKRRGAYVTSLSDRQYCDNWLSENGLKILRALPKEQPWYMQVNFTGPHSPMDVTQRMHDAWKHVEFPPPHRNDQKRFSDEDHQRNRQHYAAMIENIDRQVGRFREAVEQRGELDKTLIVFCSDHGEMLGDHGSWGKCSWRDPSIRVPLVVCGPGVRGGVTSQALVVLHDLTDTFIEAGPAPALQGTDSRSLWPVLSGRSEVHREKAVSALGGWRCVVTPTHKYVTGYKDEPEVLIDLENDPLEDKNIAQNNEKIIGSIK